MSVFVHAQGVKTLSSLRGRGVKKWQNSVHLVVDCPLRQKPMLDNIFLLEKKQEWLNQLERSKESK